MSSREEVVIIGAGVAGCSIAFHLARQGVRSVIVECDGIAARASGKAWAIWTHPLRWLGMEGQPPTQLFSMPVGGVRPWVDLFWLGYYRLPDIIQEIKEKGGIDVGYGEIPRIIAASTEEEEKKFKEQLAHHRDEGYYQTSWLEPQELRALFPDIKPTVRGGLVFPAFQVEPYRYTLGLAQAAEKMGVTIRQGEAVGFHYTGSRITSVVLASGTEIEADVVVIAMGPWSNQGASWLGKEMPIFVTRDQCLRLEVPSTLPPFALTCGVSVIPKVDGSVIVGHSGVPDPQPDYDSSITNEAQMELLEEGIKLLPSLEEAKVVEHRGDLEGWSPAPNFMQPVLGRFLEWDNAYVAARLGTLGMAMSPAVGQVMADVIIAGGHIPYYIKSMMEYLSPARL